MNRFSQLLWLIGSLSGSPQYFNGFRASLGGYGGYGLYGGYGAPLPLVTVNQAVDIGTEVKRVLASPLARDPRVAAFIDYKSPVTAAAFAYTQNLPDSNDMCGKAAKVFIRVTLGGHGLKFALAEAAQAFLAAYNSGERPAPGSGCEAAQRGFIEASSSGSRGDPITAAAEAVMNVVPQDSPCDIAAASFLESILTGSGEQEAARRTGAALIRALSSLAMGGAPASGNKACLAAVQAYWTALPVSEKTESTYFKAFITLAEKLLSGSSHSSDPVCAATLEAGSASFASGDEIQTAFLKAARAFFAESQKHQIPADSACGAGTLAYVQEYKRDPSLGDNKAAAYIVDIVTSGQATDPICAASAGAYVESYLSQGSETEAEVAAGIAYINALNKTPKNLQNNLSKSCYRAASSYIKEFNV